MTDELPQVIVLYPDAKGAELWPELPTSSDGSAHGYLNAWWHGVAFYHRDGNRYVISAAMPERSFGRLSRLLAATVYNPRVRVRYEYEVASSYEPTELRDGVGAAIRADDDILTQFHEAEELLEALAPAATFDEIAAVLRRAEMPETD